MKVMQIIDSIRHTRANTIEDKTTPLKKLLLDYCDLWESILSFFGNI